MPNKVSNREKRFPGPSRLARSYSSDAPPDVDRPGSDSRLARFGFCPRSPLPFPAFLVASPNDPYCDIRTAIRLARDWECRFADAGEAGHINADSALGDWDFGEVLLRQLLRQHRLAHADEDITSAAEQEFGVRYSHAA